MKINDFSWKIAGAAGDGILNAGLMFAKTAVSAGLYAFAAAEYPSLIRGGHNHLDVRVSSRELHSHSKNIDILIAMNADSITRHAKKLNPGGAIIFDGEKINLNSDNVGRNDIILVPMPLRKMAEENGGFIMRNVVAMGASFSLLNFDLNVFFEIVKKNFGRKGEAVVQSNMIAAQAGYDYAKDYANGFGAKMQKIEPNGNIFMSGNEAIVCGAIKAGCKFLAAYPMTPATSVMTNMAKHERKYNLVVKHTEDEIAAINMAIGASFAGARAMTCTSGGGFALMVEGLGLAAQTETPLVVVEAQRPGPATGMATHSGQGDLRFVLHAGADEFPRVVIAPGDVRECFGYTIQAFDIAEKYQLPVIVLTDKYLGESYNTEKNISDDGIENQERYIAKEEEIASNGFGKDFFKRYKITENGVSPRTIPGQKGGIYVASSYEHDEEGFEREEEHIRITMHDKRFRKFENLEREIPQPELIGHEKADLTIIGWGSTKGPILEAMKLLEKVGKRANYFQIAFISPFPTRKVSEVISNAKKTIIVENNKTSLMSSVIKEKTGLDVGHKILRYDGRPFNPEDIYSEIMKIM